MSSLEEELFVIALAFEEEERKRIKRKNRSYWIHNMERKWRISVAI
jgi:hypothetical protein